MKLSIIICAYNEEKTIKKVLADIYLRPLGIDFEVIVVDDGSTDGTPAAVRGAGVPVVYLRQPRNLGKGAAMRRGISMARGEFILMQDADCEYSPADYPALLEPLLTGRAQVVYGSRVLKKENRYSYRSYYWGGRLLSFITNFLYGCSITDEPTGYKVFSRSLLSSLELTCQGFEFCPEVTAKILRRRIPIVEVPISYVPRTREEGKKITWKDGLIAIAILFKLRFSPRGITGRRRILYIAPFSTIGGGERSLLLILNNLDRSAWEPFVACYSDGPLRERLARMKVPCEVIRRDGFLGSVRVVLRLVRLIRSKRIRLVHVNSLDIRAAMAAIFAGVPCIGHLRVIFPMTWVDALFVRLSRATVAVSRAVLKEFPGANRLYRKFVLIPNAVDVPIALTRVDLRGEYGFPGQSLIVGSCGRMEPWKGFEHFIEACRLVKERVPDACFVLCGGASDGREKAYLEALTRKAREAGLEKSLVFAGFREDILEVIAGFDVMVCASVRVGRGRGGINEGFGRTAIEAMAMGVPVVASRTGGLAEIIEDGVSGLLVESGDPASLASAVTALLQDPAKRRTLAEGGARRFSAAFTCPVHMERIQGLYRHVLRLPLSARNCDICRGTEFDMIEDSGSGYGVFQCLTCRFTFVYPQPASFTLKENYSAEYYRHWHGRARAREKMWRMRLEMIDSRKRTFRGKILDVGCAEGEFLRLAKAAGWDTTGTELSAAACDAARVSGVNVLCGRLEELKLAARSFDVITAWHVLEHVSDPLSMLSECRRLIKDDGLLVIALPNLDNAVFRLAYRFVRGRRMSLFDPRGRELHLFHFSPLTARIALENAGFSVEAVLADKGIVEPGKRAVDAIADVVSRLVGQNVNAAFTVIARPARRPG